MDVREKVGGTGIGPRKDHLPKPLAPKIQSRYDFLDDREDIVEKKPVEKKELFRSSLSTIDTLSRCDSFREARANLGGPESEQDPLSPLFWSKSCVHHCKDQSDLEAFEPFSPGFERRAVRKSFNQVVRRNAACRDQWDRLTSEHSREPMEPRSPFSPAPSNPELSRVASPIMDSFSCVDQSWFSPPNSPRQLFTPGLSTVPGDPWDMVDQRLNRLSSKGSSNGEMITRILTLLSFVFLKIAAHCKCKYVAVTRVLIACQVKMMQLTSMVCCQLAKVLQTILFPGHYSVNMSSNELMTTTESYRAVLGSEQDNVPVSEIVFHKRCYVTHVCLGGRFKVLGQADCWVKLRNVKTLEVVVYPKSELKKIANANLDPRSFLISKLKHGLKSNLDSRARLHLAKHFALLSRLAYSSLPTRRPNTPRKGNLATRKFGDLDGCAEVLNYDRDVEVYYVYDKSLQAVKFENKHEIVIAIRGTVPELLAKGTWFGPNIDTDLEIRPEFDPRYGFVHAGFLDAAKTFWQETDLARFIEDHRKNSKVPKRLYFVGQSLGAAVAMLLARFCRDDPNINYPAKRLQIHTFGCPIVFIFARQLKFHKEYLKIKGQREEHFVAERRVNSGLVDWDPRRQCEPEKIHHERWAFEYDPVAHCDGLLVFRTYCKKYTTRFRVAHIDPPSYLQGSGHYPMTYYKEFTRLLNKSDHIESICFELEKSPDSFAFS